MCTARSDIALADAPRWDRQNPPTAAERGASASSHSARTHPRIRRTQRRTPADAPIRHIADSSASPRCSFPRPAKSEGNSSDLFRPAPCREPSFRWGCPCRRRPGRPAPELARRRSPRCISRCRTACDTGFGGCGPCSDNSETGLAAFAHRRRVDERQHLLDVAHQQGVEKRLVDVLKIAKEAVFGERGGLAVEREHPAFHLLVKRADVWRQQAVQTKKVALVVGESRSFVQPRRIDKADARKRNLHRVLALSTLRVVSHCVSLPTVPGNSGLRRTRMIPLDDSLRSPALALASPNPSLGF